MKKADDSAAHAAERAKRQRGLRRSRSVSAGKRFSARSYIIVFVDLNTEFERSCAKRVFCMRPRNETKKNAARGAPDASAASRQDGGEGVFWRTREARTAKKPKHEGVFWRTREARTAKKPKHEGVFWRTREARTAKKPKRSKIEFYKTQGEIWRK